MIWRLLAVAALCGCTQHRGVQIDWQQMSYEDLQIQCASGERHKATSGCYKRTVGLCVVYTYYGDPELHDTLGHEIRHCFAGHFH